MKHIYWVRPNQLAGRAGPEKFAWAPAEILAAGVRSIVSLAGPVDAAKLRAVGLDHLALPMPMVLLEDERQRESFVRVMPLVLEFVDRSLAQAKPVLVHCHHGCDRTGTVLACILVSREGLAPDAAIQAVRDANPQAMEALGYADAVMTFARLYAPHTLSSER